LRDSSLVVQLVTLLRRGARSYALCMSKGGLRFFELEKFPNAMKHRIVGGYAKGALQILMAWSKRDVLYVDLFAGAGRYEDNQPGSPLIVAEEAARRDAAGKAPFIHCVNVERDRETFERLEVNTAHIPPAVLTNLRGDCWVVPLYSSGSAWVGS
jgi:hypothetical protein